MWVSVFVSVQSISEIYRRADETISADVGENKIINQLYIWSHLLSRFCEITESGPRAWLGLRILVDEYQQLK